MEDVHGFESRFKSLVKNIRSSNISDRNKELVLRFGDECFSNGISVARVVKCLHMLKKVAEMLAKDFDECDKDDIKAFIAKLERSEYSAWTKHDYKAILKKFYRWIRGSDEYPEEVKWIKTTFRDNDKRLPEELLTEEDVKKLIDAAENPRDRALIAVLYESGCRIGELLSLRVRNVSFDRYGAFLIVSGKTGSRRVAL
jgi:integrase